MLIYKMDVDSIWDKSYDKKLYKFQFPDNPIYADLVDAQRAKPLQEVKFSQKGDYCVKISADRYEYGNNRGKSGNNEKNFIEVFIPQLKGIYVIREDSIKFVKDLEQPPWSKEDAAASQVSVGTGSMQNEVKKHFKTVTFDDLKRWWFIEDLIKNGEQQQVVSWRKVKGLLEAAPVPPGEGGVATIYKNMIKIANQPRGGGKKKRKTKKRKSSNKNKSNKKRRTKRR